MRSERKSQEGSGWGLKRNFFCSSFYFSFFLWLGSLPGFASSSFSRTVFWVDKSKHQLHSVLLFEEGGAQLQKTYSVILGKALGDKQQESDLRTPEGIYFLKSFQVPTSAAAQTKLGVLGIALNFPNIFDRLLRRTGFGILLHGTNEPERLKRKNDTEGCVVLENSDLLELKQKVELGRTPVLIFSELTPEWMNPSIENDSLKTFFQAWIQAWENQDLEAYMLHYHPSFSAQHKNWEQWRLHKKALNERYKSIQVNPKQVFYLRHPKYSVVLFQQNYLSYLKSIPEQIGHQSSGTKILYALYQEGKWQWLSENYLEGL